MSTAPQPKFRLNYEGKNITADIAPYLIQLTYTDKIEGESDEIDLQLEDSKELWQGSWYPTKGDKMELHIGYGDKLVPAGTFEVDEVEFSGPPDRVNIRGQATGIKKAIRTKRMTAHENITVKQLADKIAAKNGLSVDGLFGKNANLVHKRISQNRETDLEFLKRVAQSYGIVFSVRSNKLVFTDQQLLEQRKASVTLDKTDVSRWSLRHKSVKTYAGAQAAWKNPDTDKVVQSVYEANPYDIVPDFLKGSVQSDTFKEYVGKFGNSADILQLKEKVENQAQADAKAQAALYRANTKEYEGEITLYGDPLICAGNNIELTGFGRMSGKWSVTESRHQFTRSGGYDTSATLKRVQGATSKQQKPKPSKVQRYGGTPNAY